MTTRRFFAAASLMATPLAILRGGAALAQISEMPPTPKSEAEQIALDAYVYGYSLITTEVTRVQMSERRKDRGPACADGAVHQHRALSAGRFPRRLGAECRHALLAGVARSRRATGVQPSRDGQAHYLFEMTDLWMTDFNSPGMRTAGGQAANYLITGTGLDRQRSGRDQADQVRDAIHGDPGADLFGRHRSGLRRGQCAAGPVQDRAAQRLRQTLLVPGATGRCRTPATA